MSHKKGKLEKCIKRPFLKDKNYWVVTLLILLQLFSLYVKEINLNRNPDKLKRQNHDKKRENDIVKYFSLINLVISL